jgi:hypothetical protein
MEKIAGVKSQISGSEMNSQVRFRGNVERGWSLCWHRSECSVTRPQLLNQ